ncbi:unnamed protein product [Effrenium voratum]|uniref:Uncharacterized protein n=1 Tax=Effrenium voratum TaxID=2562239 RepID=A0AA36J0F3_9DINO|nr:unnamed protein product [Effrenium voratum]CAJ1425589.1 unnamed protein product [Effrenium voratum]
MARARCGLVLVAWQLGALWAGAFTVFQGNLSQSWGRPAGHTVRRVRERRRASPRRRPKQRSAEGGAHTTAQMITGRVKNAASAAEVLAVMQSEHANPEMNLISVSAAWTRLARLQRSISGDLIKSPSFLSFGRLTQSLLEKPA